MDKFGIANALCVVYKEQIINFLSSLGLEYDEEIDTKNFKDMNLKKFMAWKKEIDRSADYQNFEMNNAFSNLAEHCYYLKSEGYKNLKFNLRDVEALIDKDSFAPLFRTCVVFERERTIMKWIMTDYKDDKVEWYSADVIEKIKGMCNYVLYACHCDNCDGCGYYNGCKDIECGTYQAFKIIEFLNEVDE